MGPKISIPSISFNINPCPGKKRYINRLNDQINQLDETNRGLRANVNQLKSEGDGYRNETMEHFKRIVYLIIRIYMPLLDASNRNFVKEPGNLDFTKYIIHDEEGFETKDIDDSVLDTNNDNFKIKIDTMEEVYSFLQDIKSQEERFISLKNKMEEKNKENTENYYYESGNTIEFKEKIEGFIENIEKSFMDKMENIIEMKEGFKEGFCEHEDREIDKKKKQIQERENEKQRLNNDVNYHTKKKKIKKRIL